jgi:uncharacterized protein YndB with AHSA1/START domain
MPKSADHSLVLIVRRTIAASPQRLFEAWTQPLELQRWWGPKGVVCSAAEVDPRVGGRYRIANRFPDGTTVWISGEFLRVEPPRELVYSWRLESAKSAERVTVRFEPHGEQTEVIVTHERIRDDRSRDRHQQGWDDCLSGLAVYVSGPITPNQA